MTPHPFTPGDKVRIVSVPKVESPDAYWQRRINKTKGITGRVDQVYLNGQRNIRVEFLNHYAEYYNAENLELIETTKQT